MKKRTVILLLVAVVVLLGAYLVVRNWEAISERFFPEENTVTYTESTAVIFEFDSKESITRIDWQLEGEDYTLSRDEEGDFICDEDVALDQDKIDSDLLEYLYRVLASHVLEGVSPADYGLTEPWLQITVYGTAAAEGETDAEEADATGEELSYSLSIGTYNTTTGTYYAMDDAGKVYLLYNKIPDRFGPYETFALNETAPEAATASFLSVTQGDETYDFYLAVDGDGTFYSTVFSWYMLLDDGTKQPVLVDKLDAFYKAFSELSWVGTTEANAEDLAPYGLDEPRARLQVEYTTQVAEEDETGNTVYVAEPGTFVLLVGDAMDDTHTYAMVEGTSTVRYLLTEDVQALLDPIDEEDLYMNAAVVPEWQTLQSMEITLPDGTTCFCEIQYGEEDEDDTYFIEGTQVDKETLRSVFTSMFNMDIDGVDRTSNLSTDDAVLTVRFLRNRSTYSDMTLYLIPYSSSLYVVDFAGEQKFLVTGRVLDGIVEAVNQALASVG